MCKQSKLRVEVEDIDDDKFGVYLSMDWEVITLAEEPMKWKALLKARKKLAKAYDKVNALIEREEKALGLQSL